MVLAAGTRKAPTKQQETADAQSIQNVNNIQTETQAFPLPIWAVGLGILLLLAGIITVLKKVRSREL